MLAAFGAVLMSNVKKEKLSSGNFPLSTLLPLLDHFVYGAVMFAKWNLEQAFFLGGGVGGSVYF